MHVLYKNNSMTQKIWFKKKSPLHGSGLFAKTNIKKGQKVIQSSLLGLVLSTSGAKPKKSSNRAWGGAGCLHGLALVFT